MLAAIPNLDLALTTNGSLLTDKAQPLADAGLKRISISLDSLDDDVFKAMNDAEFPVAKVLAGIDAAAAAGLDPIKINMVVKRGLNEGSILPMARYFQNTGVVVRFIEYMDVGNANGWRMDDVVTSAEIVAMIDAELPLADRAQLSGRGRQPVAVPGRQRGDRRDLVGQPAVLRELHPCPAVVRGPALHLPVRHGGPRPARLPADGQDR